MKICHIITRMIVGGAQENTLYTCQGHLAKGHDVTLITGPSPGPEGELLGKGCPSGLKIIEIPELVRQISPLKDWIAYRKIREICREQHFDVVHTHASKAGIIGRIAAYSEHVPFVVHTVHGQAFFKGQNPLVNQAYILAERFAAKYCHRIYAVAQAMIEQCVKAKVAPREKYRVVYSGMDIEAFVNARPEQELQKQLGIPENAPVVGTIARLFPLKGHDVLIEAAPKIIAAVPNVKFLLVGNGILHDKLMARTRELGVADSFIFAGLVPPVQVCRYTALMTVMAHLSLREGLPRACVQAMASAVPVVAYPLDGTPEIVIHNKTGLLCEPENKAQVADAIIQLLENKEKTRQLGLAGQELVRDKFTWQKMADILEREYLASAVR